MVRTVQSADYVAEQLTFGPKSIGVEMGLVEEAKSMRGKTADEPRPNWNPLVLPPSVSATYLKDPSRINFDHKTLLNIEHIKDESKPNTVAEVHETLTQKDEITKARCEEFLRILLETETLANETVLLVCHGATVKYLSFALEKGLNDEQKIKGDRNVCCFAGFLPLDESKPHETWKSISGHWDTGDVCDRNDNAEDRG